MATYKVIQDIEAEDKLVGPLTLRQFIYAAIAAICAYLSFIGLAHGFWPILIVLGPPMLFTGFFAFPWGRDQSTEVWALAKIRFFLMSRKRLWNQSGVRDLVTVTAPKREVRSYTNGLSQNEVQSRLSALANTLDSRGWAVKNVYAPPIMPTQNNGDRLVSISSLPQAVPTVDVTAADDILDEENNSRAHQLSEMVAASTANRKQQLMEGMRNAATQIRQTVAAPTAASGWFTQQPVNIPLPNAAIDVTPGSIAVSPSDEAALSNALHERQAAAHAADVNEHMKTIVPLAQQPQRTARPTQPATAVRQAPAAPVTPVPDPATITLANNDDLTVATISRIANKKDQNNGSGEVVISLHNHD